MDDMWENMIIPSTVSSNQSGTLALKTSTGRIVLVRWSPKLEFI
jgi:hypothetical protein